MTILLAFILAACGSDLPMNSSPSAVSLVVTPASDTVQIAAELQFVASITWSDGKERGANVTYSATGGEITPSGLYRAGRVPGEFLIIASCGCGVVDTSAVTILPPHATELVVLPSTATIDTAASLQFQSAVAWSDSADHPAVVTWSASVGSISADGLFLAGNTPGLSQVIATCDCGLTDTIVVVIATNTTNTPPQPFASLSLGISGLPAGVLAQVTVTGPAGFSRILTASAALDSLAPGDYSVDAVAVTAGANSYTPTPPSQTVRLKTGSPQVLQIGYRTAGLPPHPRVWITPARLTFLRAQVAANTIRWQRVKALADAQVALGTTFHSPNDLNALGDLGLAYLGTRDPGYAIRCGVILAGNAAQNPTVGGNSWGYNYRYNLPLVTMGLDWCYDGLTVAQRQAAAGWLMDQADWVWPASNPARVGVWGFGATNNYYYGFLMTGPAALAAAGDDPRTGQYSGADRPAFHQQLALNEWRNVVMPYFATLGAGGAWPEGTNYGSSWEVGRFADAFLTVGQPLSTPWFDQSLMWQMQSSLPGWRFQLPLGDQPRVYNAPLFSFDRNRAFLVLPSSSGTLAPLVQKWLNLIGQVPTYELAETEAMAEELLFFDPNAPAAADLSALPLDYFAPGPGYFVYRQSWTDPNATAWVFTAGIAQGHNFGAGNSLRIWKGSFWITADALVSGTDFGGASNKFNTLTVGGLGQGMDGNSQTIGTPQVSPSLVAVRGQAEDAYRIYYSPVFSNPLTDYLRTVAYLPQQDAFVIVDRATAKDPSNAKVWRWHMKDLPQVNGNTFRLQSPSADFRCFGSVLAPSDVAIGTESFALAGGGGIASHAVTVSVSGRASDVVVTVMQCTAGQSAPFAATATVGASEVTVIIAGRRVVVPLSETQPVRTE